MDRKLTDPSNDLLSNSKRQKNVKSFKERSGCQGPLRPSIAPSIPKPPSDSYPSCPPTLCGDEVWLTAASKVTSAMSKGSAVFSIAHYENRRERTRRKKSLMQKQHCDLVFTERMTDALWSPTALEHKKLRFCRFVNIIEYSPSETTVNKEVVDRNRAETRSSFKAKE